jgi:hypothetical protein
LDLVDGLDEIVRREVVYVDREQVQQKIHQIVDVVVRLVLLHPREQRHDDLAEIRLPHGPTEHSVSAVKIVRRNTHRGECNTTLALLGTNLCCTMPSNDVCWFASTIARKEGTQQRNLGWNL